MSREDSARKNLEGLELYRDGKYEEALRLFNKAIKSDTKNAAAWLNRSNTYRKLGREAEAEADMERCKVLQGEHQERDAEEVKFMGFFDKVREALRDETRDYVCASLKSMGINAKMAERGRFEEEICDKGSLGIIHIPEGAIRWVNIRKQRLPNLDGHQVTYYYTEYGVPDARLREVNPIHIRSIRKKTFPLFGKVVDALWEGEDYGTGVVSRLNSDYQLKEPVMKSQDVTIQGIHKYGCWIISTCQYANLVKRTTLSAESAELWNCYQVIAKHLLAKWSSA